MSAATNRVGRRKSWIESRVLHAIVAVGLAAAVFAVGVTGWWASTYMIPLWKVEDTVRAKVENGESARFEHVWYSKQTRIGCGYVRVKDASGRYKDERHFILFPGGELQLEPVPDAKSDTAQQIAMLEQQARHAQAIRANCVH